MRKKSNLSRMTKREMKSSRQVIGNIQKRLYANSRRPTEEGQRRLLEKIEEEKRAKEEKKKDKKE